MSSCARDMHSSFDCDHLRLAVYHSITYSQGQFAVIDLYLRTLDLKVAHGVKLILWLAHD